MQNTNKKIFFLPVNTGFFQGGLPTGQCISFYEERSSKELYSAIVGNICILGGFPTNDFCGFINEDLKWASLAECIRKRGTKPGIQLATTWEGFRGADGKSTSNWTEFKQVCSPYLKHINPDFVFKNFRNSIDLCERHGFELVEIHAAHGYLLSLLLDPNISEHAEETAERVNELAVYCNSKGLETAIRLSIFCDLEPSVEKQRLEIIDKICNGCYNFIDLSAGYYNLNKELIYPTDERLLQQRFQAFSSFSKTHIQCQCIFSGLLGVNTELPPNGHLGLCRELIANPDYLTNGMNRCLRCGSCNYYSKRESSLSCARWIATMG